MGIADFETAPSGERRVGHLSAVWTLLGEAAGSVEVGLRRLQIPPGGWSTPVHEHGREEEIFYVLAGRGVSLQGAEATAIEAGDCVVYLPGQGAHSLTATEPLDVLAFGQREHDESPGFPRLGFSVLGGRGAPTVPGIRDGYPVQYGLEAELGPPELPPVSTQRPATIVNLSQVEATRLERPSVVRTRRNLGLAAGSRRTGLQHVEVAPGKESAPPHCHSVEEEIFVVLAGGGTLVLGDQETAVGPGTVVSRPAATGVAHAFRAGLDGLTYLAYGTRNPADICYYPRSNKIAFRGVGVIGRLELLDYWDGED